MKKCSHCEYYDGSNCILTTNKRGYCNQAIKRMNSGKCSLEQFTAIREKYGVLMITSYKWYNHTPQECEDFVKFMLDLRIKEEF